jgi:O-antigen ligase
LASLFVGVFRPGLLVAVGMHAYTYESYFGGNQAIGIVVAVLPLLIAAAKLAANPRLRFIKADFIFMIWFGAYILSGLNSPDTALAVKQVARITIFAAGYYFMIRCFVHDEDSLKRHFRDFAISVLILTVLFGIVAEPNPWGRFYTVGVAHPVGWSVSINAALSILLAYLVLDRDWRMIPYRPLDILFAVGLLAAMAWIAYLNSKRGAIINPILAVIAVGMLTTLAKAQGRRRTALTTLFCVAVLSLPFAVTGMAMIVDALPDELLAPNFKAPILLLASEIGFWSEPVALDASSEGRLAVYRMVMEYIAASPLFGNGLAVLFHDFGFEQLAHSHLLELWLEGGIVLLALFVAFMIAMVWGGFSYLGSGQSPQIMAVVLTMTLGCLGQMATATSMFQGKPLWIGFGFISAACAVRARARARQGVGEPVGLLEQERLFPEASPRYP